jgi:hypothetical protein
MVPHEEVVILSPTFEAESKSLSAFKDSLLSSGLIVLVWALIIVPFQYNEFRNFEKCPLRPFLTKKSICYSIKRAPEVNEVASNNQCKPNPCHFFQIDPRSAPT